MATNCKEVELTTGKVIKVYVPPVLRIYRMLDKKYPVPQKKIVTSKTVTGQDVSMVIEDDPEYEVAVAERDAKIDEESQELNVLFALKDENPPDDFSMEDTLEILNYSNPDLTARPGRQGRKLDWIEWELLVNPVDSNRVQQAINDLISVDMEAVEQIEESFRNNVEGEAS